MAKTATIKHYKESLAKMFSEADFKRYFDMEGKILTYQDLEKINNISELLPDEKDYKIILTETKPNSGHWTTIQRRGNKIIYFDSYGLGADRELQFIPRMMNKLLHQQEHHITRLLKTSKNFGYINETNHYKYQAEGSHICSCGRWSIWSILMTNLNYSLADMETFIKKWSFELDKPNDILIIEWVP